MDGVESYVPAGTFVEITRGNSMTIYPGLYHLFKTKEGKIINADINGALNILKKGKPDRTDIISFLRNIGQTVPIRQKIKL